MQAFEQWRKERVPNWPGIGAVVGLIVGALIGYSNRPTFFGLKIPIEEIFKDRQLANDAIVTLLIWVVFP